MTWAFVLLAFAGLLIGGVISLWQQKMRVLPVIFALLALLALIGAALFAWD